MKSTAWARAKREAETIEKAEQCAVLLCADIREAHKDSEGAREVLLLDLLEQAVTIQRKLERLK